MENVFEPGIMEKYPVISEIEKFMEERGALKAMMSGSGPTVFGLFMSPARAEEAYEEMRYGVRCFYGQTGLPDSIL